MTDADATIRPLRVTTTDLQRQFTASMLLVADDDLGSSQGLRQAQDADGIDIPLAGAPDTQSRAGDGALMQMEFWIGLRSSNEHLLTCVNTFVGLRNEVGAVADIVGIEQDGWLTTLNIAVSLGNRHEILGTTPHDKHAPLRKDTMGSRGYWLLKNLGVRMPKFHPHFTATLASSTARTRAQEIYSRYPDQPSVADALVALLQRARAVQTDGRRVVTVNR